MTSDTNCTININNNGLAQTAFFTYKPSLTPSVVSVFPLRGGTGGGTRLTINGTGFPYNIRFKYCFHKEF